MSRESFNPKSGPIFVDVEVTGPVRSASLRLVLDTGATTSLIQRSTLTYLGIDPTQAVRQIQMATGSSIEIVPLVMLTRLSAFGVHRFGFTVIAHTLPSSSAVDGLLGLDFFRSHLLWVDFRTGQIELT